MCKAWCREMLLRTGGLCSAQPCTMGDILFAGSGPEILHSVTRWQRSLCRATSLFHIIWKLWTVTEWRQKTEEGVRCSPSRCTGICVKLHEIMGAQVPTEDVHAWCEQALFSPIPLLLRGRNTSWKLLLLTRTKYLFFFCPWSTTGSTCLCGHNNWLSNCLKTHLYKHLQKVKKTKEPGVSHCSAI